MTQKKVFLECEGDQYFERNKTNLINENDSIEELLKSIQLVPKKVLEIGCMNGWRLDNIRKLYHANCYGIDPSEKAIENGKNQYPKLHLQTGTADKLPYKNNFFDTIIFGFCLYLCDRSDLFKIAYESDRCLQNKGNVIILDFYPPFPYKNNYVHREGVHSYKMDYSKIFTWNPQYIEIGRIAFNTNTGFKFVDEPDERLATVVLRKNDEYAYPESPFQGK